MYVNRSEFFQLKKNPELWIVRKINVYHLYEKLFVCKKRRE